MLVYDVAVTRLSHCIVCLVLQSKRGKACIWQNAVASFKTLWPDGCGLTRCSHKELPSYAIRNAILRSIDPARQCPIKFRIYCHHQYYRNTATLTCLYRVKENSEAFTSQEA